jgi:NAD(P)-dependent dehydrogenase (short-subunit alcohol dehydrogenase family)
MADGSSVSDYAAVEELVRRTVKAYGRLDAVVNNAGIIRDRMITSMSEEDFDQVIAVHLKGTWNVTHHACRYWREEVKAGRAVSGRIVNTTSGAGLFGNIGQSNYGPAKAAIANLTQVTAMEMERYGITANAVSPIARTRMTADLPSFNTPVDGFDPLDPAITSPIVAFLCSEESGWLSGSVLRVQGDTVNVLTSWSIDPKRSYRGAPQEPVRAEALDKGLRIALGLLPGGIPSSSSRPLEPPPRGGGLNKGVRRRTLL